MKEKMGDWTGMWVCFISVDLVQTDQKDQTGSSWVRASLRRSIGPRQQTPCEERLRGWRSSEAHREDGCQPDSLRWRSETSAQTSHRQPVNNWPSRTNTTAQPAGTALTSWDSEPWATLVLQTWVDREKKKRLSAKKEQIKMWEPRQPEERLEG